MAEDIQAVEMEALQALAQAQDEAALQQWRSQYLGGKGKIRGMLSRIGSLPKEERAAYGQNVNALKETLNAAYEKQEAALEAAAIAADLEEGEIDISLPGRARPTGGLHPSTQTLREFRNIWADMGFQVYRSPEVEEDDLNFTQMNFPPGHPAREMQDTFYTTDPDVLLRTHTSPGQIRAMRELGNDGSKPVRVIIPGMCFRNEQITARSEVQFNQVEGLVVGRNIHMSDLKGTIYEFVQRMYGRGTQVRFRASYFPFTEPSMEIDISSDDMRLTKGTGWVEIGGAGMVHPVVLSNGGYDPTEWSGFAFGMGPERITMRKHDIEDIRYFWQNDLRFLDQF